MRNPHRWRNIGLVFFLGGTAATAAPFLLPEASAGDILRGILFICGTMAVLFGGGTALFRHLDARALDRLRSGVAIIARWHVDADTWRRFCELNHHMAETDGIPVNMLDVPDKVPADGVEVIVAEYGVEIGGDFHHLPRRGSPRIEHAYLREGDPVCIVLVVKYPGGGYGASGMPRPATWLSLRFPVQPGVRHDARRVVAHYVAMEAESRPRPAIALRHPRLSRKIAFVVLALCVLSFAAGMLMHRELGLIGMLMAIVGAIVGIGAAIILIAVQMKLWSERRP